MGLIRSTMVYLMILTLLDSTKGNKRESSIAAVRCPVPARYPGFETNAMKSDEDLWRMSMTKSHRSS